VFAIVFIKSGLVGAFAAIAQARKHGGHADPHAIIKALLIFYGVAILTVVSIGPIFHALIINLVWNNTRLGEHRIDCKLSPLALMWVGLSNFVLVVLTLGLFMPWAAVRLARIQVDAVTLLPASDLQEFVAAEPETVGAVGEEAATAFDFDISL
jgi:uncharacterized membrane protein YjgN (DUF898 family)